MRRNVFIKLLNKPELFLILNVQIDKLELFKMISKKKIIKKKTSKEV